MSGTIPGHVFISYTREDAAEADYVQGLLESAGIRVWRDTDSIWPGEDWREAIRRAISDDAFAFLACFSTASISRAKSSQNEELLLAIEELRRRRPDQSWLIPVRFDDCRIPDLPMGGGRTLASIHRADLFGPRRSEESARLVAAVLRILGQADDWAGDSSSARTYGRDELESLHAGGGSGLRAVVIAAASDGGFGSDLGDCLLGLGADAPVAQISLLTLGMGPRTAESADHQFVGEADVVLLVVSRDLITTQYGLSPQLSMLLRRHDRGEAVVVPVLFRAASWKHQPFGRLVPLPASGRPVAEWSSIDEAMRSVTDSLRVLLQDFTARRSGPVRVETREQQPLPVRNLAEVFTFTRVPGPTFVEPGDFQIFRSALRQPGLGIVLEGPSGIGKTTILKHAVREDADILGDVRVLSARRIADLAEIERLPHGHAGLIAVDDFHKLPGSLQGKLADYLKTLAGEDEDAKLVIIGIPGISQTLVEFGDDLATRIWVFRPKKADEDLMKKMIEQGETALNIRFTAKSEIIVASKGSLQTAQTLCWQLASLAGVQKTATETLTIPTDIAHATELVTERLALRFRPVVEQFAMLDGPSDTLCIDLLLELARGEDGVLRLDSVWDAWPEARPVIERVFVHGLPAGFCDEKAEIAEHLYYDARRRRLIADDPEFLFYLSHLTRDELLEAAGKRLPLVRDQVFICYSQADVGWRDRLQVHLRPLERDHVIDLWSDQRITPGDDWRKEFDDALARAKVAVLLVSADFLGSDFIQEAQLPVLLAAAERGGCRIVPVLVGPSLFADIPELSRYQPVNDRGPTLNELSVEASENALVRVARLLMSLFSPRQS
jgi:hypothetical protein